LRATELSYMLSPITKSFVSSAITIPPAEAWEKIPAVETEQSDDMKPLIGTLSTEERFADLG
jgi:hypothetical protein